MGSSLVALCVLLQQAAAPAQELPYAQEIAGFQRLDRESPPAKGQVLFIGSSSFTRWTTVQEAFPEVRILNRAFGGSTLVDVLARLDDVVFPYEPRQVVVYCGENDFAYDPEASVATVVGRAEELFRRVRTRLPQARFAYVSMKPSPSRWNLAPKYREANRQIRGFLAKQRGTDFVDLWPVMIGKDGRPKADLFTEDELHVNEKGYALWIPLIKKVLAKETRK
ncbi:MAG: hypothetical protein KIT11_09405 [Fimbriimonadaceae bacterium]|nr:hypothetical protein [Fimbriimonadaceae bacterium]QYK55544.1 MAG: hypothetical protein KF733_11075 [Fimbriimonadaceae bacterium]